MIDRFMKWLDIPVVAIYYNQKLIKGFHNSDVFFASMYLICLVLFIIWINVWYRRKNHEKSMWK